MITKANIKVSFSVYGFEREIYVPIGLAQIQWDKHNNS